MDIQNDKIKYEPHDFYNEPDYIADIEIKQEPEITEVDDSIFQQGWLHSSETVTNLNSYNECMEDIIIQDQIVKEEPIIYDPGTNQVLPYLEIEEEKSKSMVYFEPSINSGFDGITNQVEDKIFECYICGCKTMNAVLLKWHLQERHFLEPLPKNRLKIETKSKSRHFEKPKIQKTQGKDKKEQLKKRYPSNDQTKKSHQQKESKSSKPSSQNQTIESVFKCSYCFRSFNSKSRVERHERIHTNDHPFKCTMCSKGYMSKDNFDSHWRIHTGDMPHSCEECGMKFRSYQGLYRHKKVHAKGKYVSREEIEQLKIVKNVEPNDFRKFRIFECYLCRYRCPKVQIKVHMRENHTNWKLFQCKICLKKFAYKYSYQSHLLTHSNSNQHKCKICDKMLSSKITLARHLQTHTGESKFKHECKYCHKKYTSVNILRLHIRTHTGLKPYECEYCNKGFVRRADMRRHTLIHTGERPYKCDICEASFSRNNLLTDHKRKIHKQISK